MSDRPMILVTGATGHLGRLVVEELLARGHPAARIAALARDPAKAADLAARGVAVRQGDYTDRASLDAAFEGVERVLLVSSSSFEDRPGQHAAVIAAARAAGVALLAYTGILKGEGSGMGLAADHVATEALIRESGLPYVMLRNGWYSENFAERVKGAAATGLLVGAAGEGRIATAARSDFAAAAAAVLLEADPPAAAVHELAGDESWSYADLAGWIGAAAGREVVYRDLEPDELVRVLAEAGVPEVWGGLMADYDRGVARGALDDRGRALSRLAGRPTVPMRETVAGLLA